MDFGTRKALPFGKAERIFLTFGVREFLVEMGEGTGFGGACG